MAADLSLAPTPEASAGHLPAKCERLLEIPVPVTATSIDDPQRFADAVLRLLSDDGQHARLAAAARRLVEERYDWETIGRRFVGLVEETVARRRDEKV